MPFVQVDPCWYGFYCLGLLPLKENVVLDWNGSRRDLYCKCSGSKSETFRLLFRHFFGCHVQREDTSEKIEAISTVICRSISGFEHGAGYCTSKMEQWLGTEGSPSQKTHKRDLVKSIRRIRMVLGRQQQFQNRNCGTIVSTAPGSLISWSTSYCPCLLSCLQRTKPMCSFFPWLFCWLCCQASSGFLFSNVPDFLSFLLKIPTNSVHSSCHSAYPKEISLLKEWICHQYCCTI